MISRKTEINEEVIGQFLSGRDPMERIVNLEYKPNEDKITIFYRDVNDKKCVMTDYFHPFCWATRKACNKLCDGNKTELRALMDKYGIKVKKLDTCDVNGIERQEYDNGYLFMFYTIKAMSYKRFLEFFEKAGNPIYSKKNEDDGKKSSKQYLIVTPQEQYMIATGKRFFKGFEDYDQLLRLIFDLETEGLDPKRHRILQVGIRFNRAIPTKDGLKEYSQIFNLKGNTKEEKDKHELELIKIMLKMIQVFKPDITTAHNGENFDWWFIIERCKVLGIPLEELSKEYFDGKSVQKNKRESVLKLGGEMETYYQTIVPGTTITDSLHAVRRAQALDSNMERADLKYVTKYSKIVKPNRVYVPGDRIGITLKDKEVHYAFNDVDGDWYLYDPNSETLNVTFKKGMGDKGFTMYTRNYIADGYQLVSGQYIVERYLKDDLWECDKVEHRYNTANFLICKMLPVPFQKCCTMGTAGQWKAIMLAWSYENNLAVPMFGESKSFTGGLSRLLKVGFVDNVAKFDYNSLYPSITLTWDISDSEKDLMGAMLYFLEYVLLQREKYKGLMKKAGKLKDKLESELENFSGTEKEKAEIKDKIRRAAEEKSANDKKQLPLKILGNSFFGSYGAPNVFPFGSLVCAERITCTGRMCLRLMISHFNKLGYEPIVGDSFTGDTPLFIKYKETGEIDIKPIEEIINKTNIQIDVLDREYDYSEKPYWVLCRSGWCDCKYVYRHKTDKDIYRVSDDNGLIVDVTEDHSLYDKNKDEIKPSRITSNTELEYYDGIFKDGKGEVPYHVIYNVTLEVALGVRDRFPTVFMNLKPELQGYIVENWESMYSPSKEYSKTIQAQIMYFRNKSVID